MADDTASAGDPAGEAASFLGMEVAPPSEQPATNGRAHGADEPPAPLSDDDWKQLSADLDARSQRRRAARRSREPGMELPTTEKQRLVEFTGDWLLGQELPPQQWAVPGLIPEGLSLLAGKSKIGKSWMALGIAISVAAGGIALGEFRCPPGEVLYLALEDNAKRIQKRLRRILDGETCPTGLHFWLAAPTLDNGLAKKLHAWLAEHPDCRLVIIDTYVRVMPEQKRNGSAYQQEAKAAEVLQKLADAHECSILLIHHQRKMAADDVVDTVSGTQGIAGTCDGILMMTRERAQADALLYVTGRETEETGEYALKWDARTATWTLAGSAKEAKLGAERKQARDLLAELPGYKTPTEVARILNSRDNGSRSVDAMKHLLARMWQDGLIGNDGSGRYGVASPLSPASP